MSLYKYLWRNSCHKLHLCQHNGSICFFLYLFSCRQTEQILEKPLSWWPIPAEIWTEYLPKASQTRYPFSTLVAFANIHEVSGCVLFYTPVLWPGILLSRYVWGLKCSQQLKFRFWSSGLPRHVASHVVTNVSEEPACISFRVGTYALMRAHPSPITNQGTNSIE
jgi:hypothetical protein